MKLLTILVILMGLNKCKDCEEVHVISGQIIDATTNEPVANLDLCVKHEYPKIFGPPDRTSTAELGNVMTDADGRFTYSYVCRKPNRGNIILKETTGLTIAYGLLHEITVGSFPINNSAEQTINYSTNANINIILKPLADTFSSDTLFIMGGFRTYFHRNDSINYEGLNRYFIDTIVGNKSGALPVKTINYIHRFGSQEGLKSTEFSLVWGRGSENFRYLFSNSSDEESRKYANSYEADSVMNFFLKGEPSKNEVTIEY